jgi:phage gpG-like protein
MITGYLIGDKALIAKFEAMPARVKVDIDATTDKLGNALQIRVDRDYLRGPRPTHLGVASGRLHLSIHTGHPDTRSRFEYTPISSVAFVGSNVEYAARWERGFHGTEWVKSFTRKLAMKILRTKITKYGKEFTRRFSVKGREKGDFTTVRGFSRRVNIDARPYLAPALNAMRPTIISEYGAALQRSAVETLK